MVLGVRSRPLGRELGGSADLEGGLEEGMQAPGGHYPQPLAQASGQWFCAAVMQDVTTGGNLVKVIRDFLYFCLLSLCKSTSI